MQPMWSHRRGVSIFRNMMAGREGRVSHVLESNRPGDGQLAWTPAWVAEAGGRRNVRSAIICACSHAATVERSAIIAAPLNRTAVSPVASILLFETRLDRAWYEGAGKSCPAASPGPADSRLFRTFRFIARRPSRREPRSREVRRNRSRAPVRPHLLRLSDPSARPARRALHMRRDSMICCRAVCPPGGGQWCHEFVNEMLADMTHSQRSSGDQLRFHRHAHCGAFSVKKV